MPVSDREMAMLITCPLACLTLTVGPRAKLALKAQLNDNAGMNNRCHENSKQEVPCRNQNDPAQPTAATYLLVRYVCGINSCRYCCSKRSPRKLLLVLVPMSSTYVPHQEKLVAQGPNVTGLRSFLLGATLRHVVTPEARGRQ